MLDKLFLQILNMSFTASFVIAFVLLIRLLLKKTPKIFSYALWSVVLLRLICPFSFESVFSVLPTKANPVPTNIGFMQAPKIDTGIPIINDSINPILPEATPVASINPLQIWMFLGEILWLSGIVALLIYSLYTLYKLIKKLKGARCLNENIYMSDNISTAFVLGVVRPKIYLPLSLNNKEQDYILLHEQTHIKRLDHIVKILAFLVLCVHWFNPLVWVAFFAFSKDMEQACDEAVIKTLGNEVKKDYSASLLSLATGKRIVGGTPLAFGEGDTKGRVKNVLNYKKPAFWVIVVAVIAVALSVFCLVSNPKVNKTFPMTGHKLSDLEPFELTQNIGSLVGVDFSELKLTPDNFGLMVDSDFKYINHEVVRFLYDIKDDSAKAAQLHLRVDDNAFSVGEPSNWVSPKEQIFTLFYYLEALKYLPQEEIKAMTEDLPQRYAINLSPNNAKSNEGRQIYYDKNGVADEGGWLIRLDIQPMYGTDASDFHGVGKDIIHVYYRATDYSGTIHKVIGGTEVASVENQSLSKEIVMNSMLISAAWEGVDIGSLNDYYHIKQAIAEGEPAEDYYVFLLGEKSVLQFGKGGRYVALADKDYEALEYLFSNRTDTPVTLQDTSRIQIIIPGGNPAYGNKGKTITDKDEIAEFIQCLDSLKIRKDIAIDIAVTEPSYYRFYNGTDLISQYQFNGNDTKAIWDSNGYSLAEYKGNSPFDLYQKSQAEEVIFYQDENYSKAVELAKNLIEDSEENKIIDYTQPKVEKRTITNTHKVFDLEHKEFFDLNGQTVYQITFETEEDEILGPIVAYVDAESLAVLGIGARR